MGVIARMPGVAPLRLSPQKKAVLKPSLSPPKKSLQFTAVSAREAVAAPQLLTTLTEIVPLVAPRRKLFALEVVVLSFVVNVVPGGVVHTNESAVPDDNETVYICDSLEQKDVRPAIGFSAMAGVDAPFRLFPQK